MNAPVDDGPHLAGAPNFRDLGGCLTADGRRVRRTRVFRSEELSRLTDGDLELVRRLRIGFIADLRTPGEMAMQPTRWPDDRMPERFCAHIKWDPRINGRSMVEYLKEDPTPRGAGLVVDQTFVVLPPQCGPALKQVADRIAAGDTVLFHCTSGKDRTGVIAAMLLHILGVPRTTIAEDFLVTNRLIPQARLVASTRDYMREILGFELDDEVLRLCVRVHAHHVDIMFDTLEKQYGSAQQYLQAFGIDEAMQSSIRDRLLEPAR